MSARRLPWSVISPRYSSDKNYLKIGICLQLGRCSVPFGTEYAKEGGDPHGKFIILSFSDGEDAVFVNTVTALASVADFSTVAASADAPLLFGSLQIDPQHRLIRQGGQTVDLTPMEFDILLQTVDLTPMEFDILLLLARRPGQVFTARQIYEAVAADSYDASWTGISSMVYKLRRKLGAGIIETVRGHGYRFIPE